MDALDNRVQQTVNNVLVFALHPFAKQLQCYAHQAAVAAAFHTVSGVKDAGQDIPAKEVDQSSQSDTCQRLSRIYMSDLWIVRCA